MHKLQKKSQFQTLHLTILLIFFVKEIFYDLKKRKFRNQKENLF